MVRSLHVWRETRHAPDTYAFSGSLPFFFLQSKLYLGLYSAIPSQSRVNYTRRSGDTSGMSFPVCFLCGFICWRYSGSISRQVATKRILKTKICGLMPQRVCVMTQCSAAWHGEGENWRYESTLGWLRQNLPLRG